MKRIGKQVHFLPTGDSVKRAGEGAFARLSAVFSADEGETWGGHRVLLTCRPEDKNIMSISFLRMLDGSLGMFFIRKTGEGKEENSIIHLSRSYDEGMTWSESVRCIPCDGYFVTNNDRVIRLRSGRVIIPTSYHPALQGRATSRFFISDDDCASFHEASGRLELPFYDTVSGMQETGIAELKDGRLWAWARTAHGYQYEAFSEDQGETWSDVRPNPFFTSPLSPLGAKHIGNSKLLAVFNPIPVFNGRFSVQGAPSPHAMAKSVKSYDMYHPFMTFCGRTPLTCAVSDGGPGEFLPLLKNLEDDPELGFCYPAIFSNKDYVLIAYFFGYYKDGRAFYDSRIKKLSLDELTGKE